MIIHKRTITRTQAVREQITIGTSLALVTVLVIAMAVKSKTITVRFVVAMIGIGWILINAIISYEGLKSLQRCKKQNGCTSLDISYAGMMSCCTTSALIVMILMYGYDTWLHNIVVSKNKKSIDYASLVVCTLLIAVIVVRAYMSESYMQWYILAMLLTGF